MSHIFRYFQLIILSFLGIFLIYEYYSLPVQSQISSNILLINTTILVIALIVFSVYQNNPKYLKGQIITISFIFLLSFFIVHFFNYIGWLILPEDYEFLSQNYINRASILSSTSFIGCLIGMVLCKKPFKNAKNKNLDKIGDVPPVIMVLFMFLFILFTDKRYFAAGGNSAVLNEVGWNPVGAASYNICVAYVIANVIAVVTNNRGNKVNIKQYLKKFPQLFYLLTIIFLIIVLISGDRGPMMDIVLSYVLGYIIINHKRPNILLLCIIGVLGIFILKYLSFLRGNSDTLSIEKLEAINERMSTFHEDNIPILGDMRELSDVVNAYHLVYEFGENSFIIYGFGVLTQILAIFPGIRFIIMSLTGIPPAFYSTDQLATVLLGEDYGAGTTCVADAYYNFGFVGTIVFFILIGYFLRKLDLSIYQRGVKLFIFTIAICFFVKAIYLGRSYFFQPVTLTIYTYLIVWVSKYLNNKKLKHEKKNIIIN